MILWDGIPEASHGQLYVPALIAADICSLADHLHREAAEAISTPSRCGN